MVWGLRDKTGSLSLLFFVLLFVTLLHFWVFLLQFLNLATYKIVIFALEPVWK